MGMYDLLRNSQAVVGLRRAYDGQSERDKKATQLLILALVLGLIYFLLWSPSWHFYTSQKSEYKAAAQVLHFVQANERKARQAAQALGALSGTKRQSGSLVSLVTSVGKRSGVEIKRFEPSGATRLRIWVENMPFDKVVDWLNGLESKHGIRVQQISIDRGDRSGLVNGRLLLSD
ncbi:MAG: hypothetical protein CSA50_00790 [Gammaproteobacteria bacterium]|nr:MAG: hypothetical protein CSA50_00790 [Gammaproteobacteria bacterium]